jgi:hypothetical protein
MLPLTKVNLDLFNQIGEAAVNADVFVRLTKLDKDPDHGLVAPPVVNQVVQVGESGRAVLELWPNQRGTEASQYRISAKARKVEGQPHSSVLLWEATITVPDVAEVDLVSIIDMPPYPPVDASQQALQEVQAAAAQALLDIDDAETSAVTAITNARDGAIFDIVEARDQGVDAVEAVRDAAIATINGLVAQAQQARDDAQTAAGESSDSADLSQAWATGTEPGGVGTKSSREFSEDSAQSASDAETARNEAVAAGSEYGIFLFQDDESAVQDGGYPVILSAGSVNTFTRFYAEITSGSGEVVVNVVVNDVVEHTATITTSVTDVIDVSLSPGDSLTFDVVVTSGTPSGLWAQVDAS